MDYGLSDSSGTDDDLPPSHQNRVHRGGRVAGNGRSTVVGSVPYPRIHSDMETQIHQLEQEAYSSVLRAFKAQSDAITWEKESLITELRKELRVSDEEHRELLGRVNADDIIRRIREWRKSGGHQTGLLSNAQPVHDSIPSPSVSASRKKQKTSQSVPSLSLGAPSPSLHPQTVAGSMQPSSSAAKRGAAVGARGKKPKSGQTMPGVSSMKSMQYPSTGPTGRGQVPNRVSSGALVTNEPAEAAAFDPLIGRRVKTRWPEDNNFYEAVITDYNPVEGRHALVYDINTPDETWEWVNLKEISAEDIRWEGEDPGISRRVGRGGPGRGVKKSIGRGGALPGAGRGRGTAKGQSKKDFPPSQNGIGKKASDDIEILHTDTLIKEVERVFNASHPDPHEMEKAKKLLKEHEQSLIDAIARLADASDGESDDGEHFGHEQSMDRERGWRNRPYGGKQHTTDFDDEMGRAGRDDGSDGDRMAGEGRVASDDRHDGDDGEDDV
ncbi:protein EMSY-LIKE 3-like isoform X1 [Telopea speciosissima]|uniref:protein EMSY-LIKE 3-like isoform X1 n=1 Tax=Telopea speciosissima TaxID=54955 RepID=UPI001CC37901|nr:protein EMSY-LIKE 3-like isoform X1 [Telopea speciosissima]